MVRVSKVVLASASVAIAGLGLGACGSSTAKPAAAPAKKSGAATVTTSMKGMDHSAGSHGGAAQTVKHAVPKPLALLADGTVDPNKIDLSGTPGVTPTQLARAEAVVKASVLQLPKWKNYDTAIADGFKSIGDGFPGGEEHVIHYDWIEDNTILDPAKPESLVYKVAIEKGKIVKTLEAAMYLLPSKYSLKNPPDIGGALMQYHIHNNLCFTIEDAPKVRGITDGQGKCPAGMRKGNENAMIHVWIRGNRCGPFAALENPIAAGQTESGQRDCDAAHGDHHA